MTVMKEMRDTEAKGGVNIMQRLDYVCYIESTNGSLFANCYNWKDIANNTFKKTAQMTRIVEMMQKA